MSTPDPITDRIRIPDRRFEQLAEAIASPRTQVISVDIFDTLLWRRVPKPTDVHLLVGNRLARHGALADHVDPRAFARLRVLAEGDARRRKLAVADSTEVTLVDIHEVLTPAATPRLSSTEAAEHELAVEREIAFADHRLAAFLRQTLEARPDLRLIAVSDTYFSASQLQSSFTACSLGDLPIADIFTSSELGTGKGADLWKIVLTTLRVSPDELVHFGDNEEADVTCAQQAGIRSLLYPMHTDRYLPLDQREGITGPPGDASRYCDDEAGDGGLTAFRRRSTFLPPPRPLEERDQVAWESGTSVLGPVFTGFAHWVRQRADHAGSGRVVCMMREGRFLKTLVDRAGLVDDRPLHTATAWVSREACARASIYEGSEGELRSFLERLRAPSPALLLESFGLRGDQVPELAQLSELYTTSNGSPEAGDALIGLILDRPDLVASIVNQSSVRRRRLLEHFVAAAGPGEGPVMVVDVGWSGTIQESLEHMFRHEGVDLALHGLYLLAHVGSSDRVLRGVVLEGFLGGVGDPPFEVASITGGPELIELVCTCEDGSLLGFGEDGTPLLEPVSDNPKETAARELVQSAIGAYQAEWLGSQPSGLTFDTTPAGRAILGRILKRFLTQTNLDEAEAFSWWEHEENFGSRQVERLVPGHYLETLRYRTAENLHWAPMSELYWVGGAAGLIDNETTDAIRLMREGTVDPGRFSSLSEVGGATLAISYGPGDGRTETVSVPVTVNRNGLTLVEWAGPAAGLRRLVLHPAQRDAVIRLDLLDVVVTLPEGTVLSLFRWQDGDQPGRLLGSGVRWVAPGLMAVDGASAITVEVDERLTGGEIRVSLAGAYLPSPPGISLSTASTEAELSATRRELDALHRTALLRMAAKPRRLYGALRQRLGRQNR